MKCSLFGYECKTAANGREALSILQDDYFPIILSDFRMPVMDGIELLLTSYERGKTIKD